MRLTVASSRLGRACGRRKRGLHVEVLVPAKTADHDSPQLEPSLRTVTRYGLASLGLTLALTGALR